MLKKPRLLDLFCGAGGAAKGYQKAGFYVVGVDIAPQPRYCGDEFYQADALDYPLEGFDAYHASPPCQGYSCTINLHPTKVYPKLIEPVRDRLVATDKPYIIENVVGAPLLTTIMLCGAMFGLRIYRHRLFESNILIWQPAHPRHVHRVLNRHWRRDWSGFFCVTGGCNQPLSQSKAAMEIDWMISAELVQAIPPAYTQYIGKYIREV